jgi:short-subunit dehydrogenase
MSKRIVLITGASSGIGREIAKQLVQKGDFPLLVARNRDALQDLKNEIKQCEIFPCDVTNQEQVESMVDQIMAKFHCVDVLINNAGYGRFGGILDIPINDFQGMIETNYLGAVRLTRTLLPHMLLQGDGRIINIASIAGLTGIPNLSAYCASKFALIGFSESLKLEYAPHIKVGVLCPGPVQTPFFQGVAPQHHFPTLILRHLLDVEVVARHAIQLIKHPRVKVIPHKLSWAMNMRRVAPKLYLWITQKIYRSFKKKKQQVQLVKG